jgi:Bacterial Ig-like domain (group 2)
MTTTTFRSQFTAIVLAVGVLLSWACTGTEPIPVASVTINGAPSSLTVGQTTQLVAVASDAKGNDLGRPIEWSSSNLGVATVTANGLVTAVTPGSVGITAASGGRSTTAAITVLQPYPAIAGTYAYAALFDGLPQSTANGTGSLTITQPNRTQPNVTFSPNYNWVISSTRYAFTGSYGGTVNVQGGISFTMTGQGVNWSHTANAQTVNGSPGFVGRHTISDGTETLSGPWALQRVSGYSAMMVDRGVATEDDLAGFTKALSQMRRN